MKKVLIVEDDPIVANLYRNKFLIDGFEVEIALDGLAGLNAIRAFHPDVVVLELILPKVSGVELIQQIRAEPGYGKLPLIVFSSTYLTGKIQEAWQAGATKCISKASCTSAQLIDVVNNCLARNDASNASPQVAQVPASEFPAASPASPPNAPAPGGSPEDVAFEADLLRTFVDSLPATLAALRTSLQGLSKAPDEPTRLDHLQVLHRRVLTVAANAGIVGLPEIAQMSEALGGLIKDVVENPKHLNASSLRTVASAVDFLGVLFQRGVCPQPGEIQPPAILVVDDEEISRRAVIYALGKAKFKAVSVADPLAALKLLSERGFDLVFLDVDMPGMNGFELCSKLRELPAHKATPVVFVTSLNDFESRANSSISGGNDFIGKPFLFMELAVKSMLHLLRGRLGD